MSRRVDPVAKIHRGLALVREGIAEGRADLEALEHRAAALRSGLVGGEAALRSIATSAQRARMPRCLAAGETSGPRRLPADQRAVITVTSEPDEATLRSLRTMGLGPRRQDEAVARLPFPRGILRRA